MDGRRQERPVEVLASRRQVAAHLGRRRRARHDRPRREDVATGRLWTASEGVNSHIARTKDNKRGGQEVKKESPMRVTEWGNQTEMLVNLTGLEDMHF